MMSQKKFREIDNTNSISKAILTIFFAGQRFSFKNVIFCRKIKKKKNIPKLRLNQQHPRMKTFSNLMMKIKRKLNMKNSFQVWPSMIFNLISFMETCSGISTIIIVQIRLPVWLIVSAVICA